MTPETLAAAACIPQERAEQWADALTAAMDEMSIDTPQRQAAFIAQMAHESQNFTRLEENLSYSTPERLVTVFGKRRFLAIVGNPDGTDEAAIRAASTYCHNPQALANLVYANRLGNGDMASGDGWRYRGRGALQVTGRANYADLDRVLGSNYVVNPDQLTTPIQAARSAAAWWRARGLNAAADKNDFTLITKTVNGPAMLGEAERVALYETALGVLA